MNIYDISMKIKSSDAEVKTEEKKAPEHYNKDAISLISSIDLNLHHGTHVTSPGYILENGGSIEEMLLSKLITKCKVLDFTNIKESISKDELKAKNIEKGDFILLKTKNSLSESPNPDFVYLDKVGAKYLAKIGVIGVGIDAVKIERDQRSNETYKMLYENGIYVIEGLRLQFIKEEEYILVAVPLNIENAQASPVRAVLIDGLIDKLKLKPKDSIEEDKEDKCNC